MLKCMRTVVELHRHFPVLVKTIFLHNHRLLPLASLGKRWWGAFVSLLHDFLKGLEPIRLALDIAYSNACLLSDSRIVAAIWNVGFLYAAPCGTDAAFARCGCHRVKSALSSCLGPVGNKQTRQTRLILFGIALCSCHLWPRRVCADWSNHICVVFTHAQEREIKVSLMLLTLIIH